MSQIVIDVNILLGMIAIGIAIGSAVLAFAFKNTRCITRIEGKINTVESSVNAHLARSEKESERLRKVELDIAGMKRSPV